MEHRPGLTTKVYGAAVRRPDFHHIVCLVVGLIFAFPAAHGQSEIAFVSDTQAPMRVETIALKENNNVEATSLLFHDILRQHPARLFILGDVTNLSKKEKRWEKMDRYLDSCRQAGISVSAVLGNHDVMSSSSKGEARFRERFPEHNRTGYFTVIDSTALILLNSNFKKLSSGDLQAQQAWYQSTLDQLDSDPAVAVIIIACHHAPYSNSTIVGSTEAVQEHFVPGYLKSPKARLFITGHSHNFEHFKMEGKEFLVIGGGGGLHQPLSTKADRLPDLNPDYKPEFHYVLMRRTPHHLQFRTRFLKPDFSGMMDGISFAINY